ncbi:hypothetical protein H0H81_008579 [Sphagnurus paluster]|uniref:Uncharacterized protein n=1 Tax=Sphagnurus paluster TaxID=117069 RepID=A0A9P7GW76_9AGAR|nr:hypothetical protein H0H81_008579 [Sphagnurus paluster]
MGQYFILLNLDSGNHVSTGVSGKFGEFFWSIWNSELGQALWSPPGGRFNVKRYSELPRKLKKEYDGPQYTHPHAYRSPGYHYPKQNSANHTGNGFRRFSNELIDLIYQALDDFPAILALAATCQRSYDVGRRYFERWLRTLFAPSWAGDRLICIGDYTCADDLPPSMLTGEDLEYINNQAFVEDDSDVDEHGTNSFSDIDSDLEEVALWSELAMLQRRHPDWELQKLSARKRRKRAYEWELYVRFLHHRGWGRTDGSFCVEEDVLNRLITIRDIPRDLEFDEEDSDDDEIGNREQEIKPDYVLRNLTTKEFVRGDAIRDLRKNVRYPRLRQLSFNHVLLARITWSSDPSLSMPYEGPLHRGVWAGHRFDISEIGTVFDGQQSMGSWKDVSEVVLREMCDIADAEMRVYPGV